MSALHTHLPLPMNLNSLAKRDTYGLAKMESKYQHLDSIHYNIYRTEIVHTALTLVLLFNVTITVAYPFNLIPLQI